VIGTVSNEEKARIALEAGLHDVIVYTRVDFVTEVKRLTAGHGADLIFDAVGKTTFTGDLQAAATRGHIVVFGATSGLAEPVSPNMLMGRALTLSGGSLANFVVTREETMRRAKGVLDALREGWLKLRIDHVLPFSQAAEAHRLLESRETSGKIVLMNATPDA
jgi:NADPH2:quinone reductase